MMIHSAARVRTRKTGSLPARRGSQRNVRGCVMSDLSLLISSLIYNPLTGEFIRTASRNRPDMVGKRADSFTQHGYRVLCVCGVRYYAHRVAWLFVYGEWPDHIDHINGIGTDNRIVNLRSCSQAENVRNQRISIKNKSGCKNVSWHTKSQKWMVTVTIAKKQQYFGLFEDIDDAKNMARQAVMLVHGQFGNHALKE
jgi:hypothetical protein